MKPVERKPHVSRLPYLPPVEPEREHHELAEMLVGAAAVVLLCLFAFVLLPVLL